MQPNPFGAMVMPRGPKLHLEEERGHPVQVGSCSCRYQGQPRRSGVVSYESRRAQRVVVEEGRVTTGSEERWSLW